VTATVIAQEDNIDVYVGPTSWAQVTYRSRPATWATATHIGRSVGPSAAARVSQCDSRPVLRLVSHWSAMITWG